MALEVVDNPDRSRYELRDDGHLVGYTEYHERDGVLVFPHTVITEPEARCGVRHHARAGRARRRARPRPHDRGGVPVRGRSSWTSTPSTPTSSPPDVAEFPFAFDPRFRWLLALAGVRPDSARVFLTRDRLVARFGPWVCATSVANVSGVDDHRPVPLVHRHRRAGGRSSTAASPSAPPPPGGVCIRFLEPVTGLDPFGRMRHPGLTVTVADREGLAGALTAAAGL